MTEIGPMDQTRPASALLIGGEPEDARKLRGCSWQVVRLANLEEAMSRQKSLDQRQICAVILDEALTIGDLSADINALKSRLSRVPLLLLTSERLQAKVLPPEFDGHIERPIDPHQLLHALRNTTGRGSAIRGHIDAVDESVEDFGKFASLVGNHPTFKRALKQAAVSARGHQPILVEGELGTGKEALARAIHAASPQASMPLRYVNVGRAKDAQLESMLFGHRRGAFVGAFERRTGLLEESAGGTLILDEAERLPRSVQDRLADALRDRCVRPMGDLLGVPMNVRVIALSAGSLESQAKMGTYSSELLAELSKTHIRLPPLRERRSDIPLIAREFVAKLLSASEGSEVTLTEDALRLLAGFSWPGNVRQLQAALFQAVMFARGPILNAELFSSISRATDTSTDILRGAPCQLSGMFELYGADGHIRRLVEIEADVIRMAITQYKGRLTEAAKRLGMGRSTLYRKLDMLGVGMHRSEASAGNDAADGADDARQ